MTDFVYKILDGSKTTDKTSFLQEISNLLYFPDYFEHNWDAFNGCLNNLQDWNWPDEITYKITVIWLDPLNFSKYNNADFLTALDILKVATEDETTPLTFILATNIVNVNTDLFK
jgi:RNAse (barnase) inhibitor barstar